MLRIKEIMKEKNVTAQDLAEKLDVTSSCISRYINGNPTVSTLYKLADALGVTVTDLFNTEIPSIEGYVIIDRQLYRLNSTEDLKKALETARHGMQHG